ncbi:hypothetical protein [Pyxidicoccus sp. MSG2]|uniref:hypothetical protein n=1 Tax=Pyxidicoccus sp. MSG2 TaxID=2996790 RepID=UPI00226E0374|nr:hypothetical protein [Pyxidicoccus sp. MSG2]MCY1017265.1 hypothetical protein [Pyxidicoccus sp. MSG2]
MALVAVLAVLLPGAGHPCPIMPMTTWELTQQAEHIVLGRVVRSWRAKPTPWDVASPLETEDARILRERLRDLAPRDRVELEVREAWKGAPARTFTIVSDENWDDLLHAQERHGKDHTLLVFLSPEDDGWHTTGYESERVLANEDVAAWRERVKEALALQALASVHEQALVDWNVLAVSNLATRLDGLTSLFDQYPLWYSDRDHPLEIPHPHPLHSAAQRRIADSFIAHPGPPSMVWLMLLALDGQGHPDVDRVAAGLIDQQLANGGDDFLELQGAQDAMDLLSARLGASSPGTDRCRHHQLEAMHLATLTACVRARWDHLRAMLPEPRP